MVQNTTERKLAIVGIEGLGNLVSSFPVIFSLSKRYDAELFAMNNGSKEFFGAFDIDLRVKSFDSFRHVLFSGRPKYDLAVALYPNYKGTMLALHDIRATRKICVSRKRFWFTWMNTFEHVPWESGHDLDNNAKLLSGLADGANPEWDMSPFSRDDPGVDAGLVVVHPTASKTIKYYPTSFWADVIRGLRSQGRRIKMLCGPSITETDFVKKVLAEVVDPEIDVMVGAPMRDVVETISRSGLFVGCDSALVHIAALFDVKLLVLWTLGAACRIYPYASDSNVYIAKEVVDHDTYMPYPNSVPWMRRGSPDEVLAILDGTRNHDYTRRTRFRRDVKFYVF